MAAEVLRLALLWATWEPEDPRLVGEVNAGLGFNGCAEMLTRDFDHSTKLFFMMRNPVDRAWSAFKFFCALGFLPMM